MGNNWTEEQLEVIQTRDKNLLVSAAAGSGKTAVLVERIIERITDPVKPIDIDRILVVTFTKAAAAEMRERIGDAVEARREQEPDNENLIRQASLIHNAKITTIDSFCTFVVRNHFEEINLDPNFRIADQGELQLMEQDVLAQVFEDAYAQKRESFLKLVDLYGTSRSDLGVRDMVMNIYHLSASSPWPREWIAGLRNMYQCTSVEELIHTQLLEEITASVHMTLEETLQNSIHGKEICKDIPELEKYELMFVNDCKFIEEAVACANFKELQELFYGFSLPTKARPKKIADGDPKCAIRDEASAIRDEVKKSLDGIRDQFFGDTVETLFAQVQRLQPVVNEIVSLTLTFVEAMDERKRKKRIMDFADIEHMALRIFIDEETKEIRPTAMEFRQHFEEIMIDEYQDSNQVQDTILTAISGQKDGKYNLFMVGDVKQSIYKFRLARPELFMEKYATYAKESEHCKRIDLHKNFRSRKEVLDYSNDIFYKVMQKDLGKVAYDEAAALYPGASFDENADMDAELLLLNLEEAVAQEDNSQDLDKIHMEAYMVAKRIQKLLDTMQVKDKNTKEMRPLCYSDVVILLRSLKDWGTTFAEVLEELGIPAHVESSTGYFSAMEVQTILNLLRILDNPYQDIPMAAVLKSPFVGLDDEELAEIGRHDKEETTNLSFAQKALMHMQKDEGKLHAFYLFYMRMRAQKDLPIHELISQIITETGYADYVASLPAGRKRLANIQMLVEKAIAYEKTSYKGLFHFVRYIDQLQKYDVDFGEADVTSENANVVHLMTIHKSKGLEFPVVFVSGLGKKFNMMDTNARMVIHSDLGLGIDEMRSNPKRKVPCMLRNQIADCMRREALGEELRVLYVALTRAKEKLILTGTVANEKEAYDYTGNAKEHMPISYSQRVQAKCYLDYVLPAMLSYPDRYQIAFTQLDNLVKDEALALAKETLAYEQLMDKIAQVDSANKAKLKEQFAFTYAYMSEIDKKIKYSVSELKHASMEKAFGEEDKDATVPEFLKKEHESYVPDFAWQANASPNAEAKSKKTVFGVSQGALRGTAVHRVMECLDFAAILSIDVRDEKQVHAFVKTQLEQMLSKQELTEEMYALVKPAVLERFVKSEVASRMALADSKGDLYREKPFVMKLDGVLIQGIIDVFWEEADGVVVLDYKTDRVQNQEELVLRYKTQLDLYADALTRIYLSRDTAIKTKESLIYSFALSEVVKL